MATMNTPHQRNAMDSTQHYTVAQLQQMRAQGINTVFRYFGGGGDWKRLNRQDIENFRAAGMNLALIYQGQGNNPGSFSREQGIADARAAIADAVRLGLPPDSAVYFAVDYDASQGDVSSRILPYFQGIREELLRDALQRQGPPMRVGVYGSGAVCKSVHDSGLAQRTWLAGSSGWRGTQEFFRSGRWDVLQHIIGNRDYDTINPLTEGVGSVNFDRGRVYTQAMGRGAESVTPEQAARNLQTWLTTPATGDAEHDETRDQFYQNAQERLGLNRDDVGTILQEGGPLAIILMFFMFLLVGADKMQDIGTRGQSTRPNAPPPPAVSPFAVGPDTQPSQGRLEIDQSLNLGTQGAAIISTLVAQGVKVDLVGQNGVATPDGKFDRNDLIAMGSMLRENGTVIERPETNPLVVLNAYQLRFGEQQQQKPAPAAAPR